MWNYKSYPGCHIHENAFSLTDLDRDWGLLRYQMDLCACVSKERRDGEGSDLRELSRLTLESHRREVTGVYDTLLTDIHRKTHVNCVKKGTDM